jgi:hypothetical protein
MTSPSQQSGRELLKPCRICKAVRSKLKPRRCKCGKKPRVGHFNVVIEWHVSCDCGESTEEFGSYHLAVSAWNRRRTSSTGEDLNER